MTNVTKLKELIGAETVQQLNDLQVEDLVKFMGKENSHEKLLSVKGDLEKVVGWAIIGVFGQDGFAYTVGGTDLLGYELIAAIPPGPAAIVINPYMEMLEEGDITVEEALIERTDIIKNGYRTKLVEIDAEEIKSTHLFFNNQKVTRVYQVLVADVNNVLPDEEGYDTSDIFSQTLYKFPDAS